MGEPLKTFFSPALVKRLASTIAAVEPSFGARAFIAEAAAGLEELELLDRARHIAAVLGKHLPSRYEDALAVLLRSLGPEHAGDELVGVGMAPFFYFPHVIFVAERGLEHVELSMGALHELTRRFTAEFSIRPFLERYPDRVFSQLEVWARDPSPHVRRLVSEGTRLRLPWGARVAYLDRHPERVIALLELLKDDPTTLVRRSVANNLNDVGKAHPALLIETCARWLEGASAERRALVEHALRSAIKRGEAAAIELVGYGNKARVTVGDVCFEPARVAIGQRVDVSFTVTSRSKKPQELLVDLAVHFVKASGATSRKVFKLRRVSLAAGAAETFRKSISLAVHTTRTPYPGEHRVDALVNGESTPLGAFEVEAPRRRGSAR